MPADAIGASSANALRIERLRNKFIAIIRSDWLNASMIKSNWSNAIRLSLVAQMFGFAFMVAGTHGVFGPQPTPPTTTDFASFYAAGLLANHGMPQSAYSEADHRAAEFQAVSPGIEEKRFMNPPVFLLVCAALARLPYLLAFMIFECATFAIWLTLTTRITGGGPLATMTLAAIPSVWWALGWGQNSFLSASLVAAGTLLLRQRPLVAGAAMGALCFKPHLGLLIPVALVAGRHWRAIIGAVASVGALSATSVLCFGSITWKSFFLALQATPSVETGTGLSAHIDVGSAARLLSASSEVGWAIQAAATGVSATCVAWLWQRASASDKHNDEADFLANAGLIAGTLVAAPFLLFYDLVLAGVAAAWLTRNARQHGWRRSEAVAFATLMCLDFLSFPSAALLHIAVGALVPMSLVWLSVQRASSLRLGASGHRLDTALD